MRLIVLIFFMIYNFLDEKQHLKTKLTKYNITITKKNKEKKTHERKD